MTNIPGETVEPLSTDEKPDVSVTSPDHQDANYKDSAREAVDSLKSAASAAKDAATAAAAQARDSATAAAAHARATGEHWRGQATGATEQAIAAARHAATGAKDKAGSALHSLSKLITDTASTVDEKMGPQYGDYARTAARSVAGAAETLDARDIDQIVADAREFVRKQPAVAIGAAAVLGFVLMRLAKGDSRKDSDDKDEA